MDPSVEHAHCGVVMTSWSAAGSPTRYYQCPSCGRTFCSAYSEILHRAAGARSLGGSTAPVLAPARRAAGPLPAPDDPGWRELKGRAARWFAHVEADVRRLATPAPPLAPGVTAAAAALGYRKPRRG